MVEGLIFGGEDGWYCGIENEAEESEEEFNKDILVSAFHEYHKLDSPI